MIAAKFIDSSCLCLLRIAVLARTCARSAVYGFIQPQGGGKDVFVHISAVERAGLTSLNEGQTVQYEIESNRGKESAVNLKVSK
jgi:CspA family cold shock protein